MEKLRACISSEIAIDKDTMDDILSVFESGYMRMYNLVDGKEITF